MSTNPQRSRATAFGLITEREQSGSFPIERVDDSQQLESDLVIAELAPDLVSMIPEPPLEARRSFAPPPRPATPSERAELVIEDLSLQLDNPYLASSLVPPPKQPFPMRRVVAIGAGMLAAAAIGAVVQLSVLRSAQPTDVNAGAAGIAPPVAVAAVGSVASAKTTQPAPREAVIAPPQAPVVASVAIEAAPPAAPVVAAEAPKVEQAQVEQAQATTAVVPAAPVRIARITPPAPPEPTTLVAEAAISAEPAVPAIDLPQYPTREQVTAGFESVRAALAQCAAGRAGTAEIKASIASNGRILHALIGGDFRGSVEGSCMARAVREAQFPAFSEPRLKVSYPISL